MEIQNYPIKYMKLPELRTFPIEIDSLVIASENMSSISIENLIKNHISMNGQTVEYNYAVMKSGEVFSLRPEIYESSMAVMPNTLSVLVEGDFHSESMTVEQEQSLENLSLYAMEKFSIPWNGVLSVDDIVGGSKMGEFFSTSSLQKAVETELRDFASSSLGLKTIGAYRTTADESYGVMYTTSKISTIKDVINVTGNDISALNAMNSTIQSFNKYIPVGTPIMYVKTMTSYENLEKTIPTRLVSASVESTSSKVNTLISVLSPATRTYDFKREISTTKSIVDHNRYGGRPMPSWYQTGLSLPGYDTAAIKIYNRANNEAKVIYFQVSPSSFSDSRRPNYQILRSQSGFFVWRNGEQPATITFSGSMLDSKEVPERHSFLTAYKRYIEDKHTEYMEYFNEFTQKLCIEGIEYSGIITGITFSKNADKAYLYEYNVEFLSFSQRNVYMKESSIGLTWAAAPETTYLMKTVQDSFKQAQTTPVNSKPITYSVSTRVAEVLGGVRQSSY